MLDKMKHSVWSIKIERYENRGDDGKKASMQRLDD